MSADLPAHQAVSTGPVNPQGSVPPIDQPPIDPSDLAKVEYALRRRREAMMDFKIAKDIAARMIEPTRTNSNPNQLVRMQLPQLIEHIRGMEARQRAIAPLVDANLELSLRQFRMARQILFFQNNPINSLPPEILTNIFRYVVWTTNNPETGVAFRLQLTWVCRHWRTIAIQDSTIWSSIWFRDPPPYERSLTWFDRAGTAPLDLRINERDQGWDGEEDGHRFTGEQMKTLLDRLFTKASQIRMLIVIVDNWPPALVVLDKLREAGRSGNLIIERFELHRAGKPYVWIGAGYAPETHRNPITLFDGVPTPSLKYLVLNGITVHWNRSPLFNLTTLDMRRIPLDASPDLLRFREILGGCPKLQKLCLDGAGPRPRNQQDVLEPTRDPIYLPNLITLIIGDFSLKYAVYVICLIMAPRVRDLTLMNMTGEDYSPVFAAMTSRFREVRLLTVYTVEFQLSPRSRTTMVKWLESMPDIAFMRLAQVSDIFLNIFLEDPQDYNSEPRLSTRQILCPKLSIVEYQAVKTPAIVKWALGRRAIGVPLRKIYVSHKWAEQIDKENFRAIRAVAPLFVTQGGAPPEEQEIMQAP